MLTKQENEALLRLNQLVDLYGLTKDVVEDFQVRRLIHCSATTLNYDNRMDWVAQNIEQLKKEKGILPYYIMLDPAYITVLYVGTHEEDWVKERPSYLDNIIFAYVINVDMPQYSEFGSVGIKGVHNVVLRVS